MQKWTTLNIETDTSNAKKEKAYYRLNIGLEIGINFVSKDVNVVRTQSFSTQFTHSVEKTAYIKGFWNI